MPSALDLAVVVEVDEVHQQLVARGARETRRVPAGSHTGPGGEHRHLTATDALSTLKRGRERGIEKDRGEERER